MPHKIKDLTQADKVSAPVSVSPGGHSPPLFRGASPREKKFYSESRNTRFKELDALIAAEKRRETAARLGGPRPKKRFRPVCLPHRACFVCGSIRWCGHREPRVEAAEWEALSKCSQQSKSQA